MREKGFSVLLRDKACENLFLSAVDSSSLPTEQQTAFIKYDLSAGCYVTQFGVFFFTIHNHLKEKKKKPSTERDKKQGEETSSVSKWETDIITKAMDMAINILGYQKRTDS